MKVWIIGLLLVLTSSTFAQVGVSFGTSIIKGFGGKGTYGGAHIGIEIPRDDEVSYFGRLTMTPYQYQTESDLYIEPKDYNVTPGGTVIPFKTGYNYVNIEGGTRYYLGNSFDYGFSAYGGSMFMLSINSVKPKFGDFDNTIYQLPEGYDENGRIMSLNLGISGGIKNSFSFGVLYLDGSLTYALFNAINNNLANAAGARYSPLNFIINLGIRKDLY